MTLRIPFGVYYASDVGFISVATGKPKDARFNEAWFSQRHKFPSSLTAAYELWPDLKPPVADSHITNLGTACMRFRLTRVQRAQLLDAADSYANKEAPSVDELENNFINTVLNILDNG